MNNTSKIKKSQEIQGQSLTIPLTISTDEAIQFRGLIRITLCSLPRKKLE